jgi:two-component system nitrogen regulation sensor histidine kinase NtrY
MNLRMDWRFLRYFSTRRTIRYVVFFVFLIAISSGGASLYRNYIQGHWQEILLDEEQQVKKDFQARFHLFEQSIHQSLDSIRAVPSLQYVYSTDDDSVQEEIFFTRVLPQLKTNLSLEVYDEDKHLIGWNGPRGPTFRMNNLSDQSHAFIADDQIYTYLLVSHPLRVGSDIVGYLVGKRLLDVDYPINNRFINREAFQTSSGIDLLQPEEYDFSSKASVSTDPHRISVEVVGIDGAKLGYAYLQREDLEMKLQQVSGYELFLVKLFSLVIALLVLVRIASGVRSISSSLGRLFLWTLILWMFRYFLLIINFPSAYLHLKIFDPVTFASSFGFGLAKSPGEFFLSCAVLLLNTGIAVSAGVKTTAYRFIVRMKNTRGRNITGTLVLFILIVTMSALLRAYFAILRSAVFDSTIPFYDPSSVFPSVEMTVMLLSLLFLAIVLTMSSLFLGLLMKKIAKVVFPGSGHFIRRWGILVILSTVVGILFGISQSEPLVEPWQRILFLLWVLCFSTWMEKYYQRQLALRFVGFLLLVYIFSVTLLIPILNETVHEYDRLHVELAAQETSQPADAWLTMVVQQALKQLRDKDALESLRSSDRDDLNALAFREWAKSILGREGYLCSVTYVDDRGDVVSDFHIGVPPHPSGGHHVIVPMVSPTLHTEERVVNGRTMIWHSGYESLVDSTGDTVGGVLVEVSGSRQNVLESEVPEFLRNYSNDNFQMHYRPLILSEYYQGKLTYSTDDSFPLTKTLPAEISARGKSSGQWVDELIDGRWFESYYSSGDPKHGGNLLVALSIPRPTWHWYFYSYLRYFVFFLLLLSIIVVSYQVYIYWRRGKQLTSYRRKVLFAFCIVSIIPVIILGYYNRQYTFQQSEETTTSRLEEQTSIVLGEIQRQVGSLTPVMLAQFSDDRCAQLASIIKTDFNIYLIRSFLASSKPEIFLAGVLDTRLSAEAYANIIIQRKKFFIEHQQIGTLPYIVGYRPVIAEDGSVIGVISVPTLYRQIEINEDLTRRNSFLYGVYTLAIIMSMLVATIFANQISSPIRRLTNATRQIGSGRLDVRIPQESMDEMGQLEQAFQQMTENLRKTQQEMMRSQREVAWREMAKQVAHEIKNPLTPMKLAVQHLRQAYVDGVKNFQELFQQVSETLLEQIDTLNRIASEFSQYAKMPERRPQVCDVQAILKEAVNLHRQHAHISFKERYEEKPSFVVADREELRRVFINILKNSIQAIADAGQITITCRLVNASVEVEIIDTGVGISSDLENKIFEPNFSTKTEGTGLGLAIVKQIIDDTRGTIRVTSEVGHGTRVTINLPRADTIA